MHDGTKDWQPTAWSPRTKLLYVPHQHMCMNWKSNEVGYIAGTPYVGATVDTYPGPGGYRGEYMAWDPVQKKKVWAIKENFPVWTGTLVTAGDVAFYGTMDRLFKAVNAKTGEVLWQFPRHQAISGSPSPTRARTARNMSPCSQAWAAAGAVAVGEIDPRVRNGALGFVGGMQDLPRYTAGGSTLMVFSLPKPQQASNSSGGQHAEAK